MQTHWEGGVAGGWSCLLLCTCPVLWMHLIAFTKVLPTNVSCSLYQNFVKRAVLYLWNPLNIHTETQLTSGSSFIPGNVIGTGPSTTSASENSSPSYWWHDDTYHAKILCISHHTHLGFSVIC
jgi:hypothetical protein